MNNKRMDYVVIYEKGDSSYGAYVPDLPGCFAVGDTLKEVETLIQEAIEFHIEGLQEDGDDVPQPSFRIYGTLVGISVRDKTFEIETSDENYYEKDFFKGKITDEAIETEIVKNATINKQYTAQIQGIAEIGETKDETNIKFKLLSLSKM